MSGVLDTDVLFARFGAALLLGLLVGLEREWAKATDKALFAGIRTFPFISLLGCVSAMIAANQGLGWFFAASYLGFSVFVAANHFVAGGVPGHGPGTTTEVTSMLVFLFGGLVYWGHGGLAAALTVAVTLILSIKQPLHDLTQRVESQDISATLQFAVVSIIILPLLPDTELHLEQLSFLDVLNPRHVWLVVVLVSGVAFAGYVANKAIGAHHGIPLTGLLGGIVSSTAVAMTMAGRSKDGEEYAPQLTLAVALAWAMRPPRTLVEISFINPPLAAALIVPLGSLGLVAACASVYLWRRSRSSAAPSVTIKNPFRLAPALRFGALFAFMLVVNRLAIERFASAGMYLAALLGGLVDTRPVALSVANLAHHGEISQRSAMMAVIIGATSNTAINGVIASAAGAGRFRRLVLAVAGLLVAGGIVATVLVAQFGTANLGLPE